MIENIVIAAATSFLAGVAVAWLIKKHSNIPEYALRLEYVVYFNTLQKENILPESDLLQKCEWISPATHPAYFHPELLLGEHASHSLLPANLREAVSACKISSRAPMDAPSWEPLKSAVQFILRFCQQPSTLTVLDRENNRFYSREEWLNTFLSPDRLMNFESHVETEWEDQIHMGRAYTKGMSKAGFPEIEMRRVPLDHRTLALFLVSSSASECWKRGTIAPLELEGFGECFRIEFRERQWHEHKRGALSIQIRALRKRKDYAVS